jgi:hypothetical protein
VRTWQDWNAVHQPYELRYHTRKGIEWCSNEERFRGFWTAVFQFAGIGSGQRTLLDVGCGPRPPFARYATAASVFAIEPLANEYRKLVPPEWWQGVVAFAQPAETFLPDLAGRCDAVMCWNCLDHTIGWRQILSNIAAYGSSDAVYAVATDFKPPAVGHPGFDRDEFFNELTKNFRIVEQREGFQRLDVALVLERVT